MSQAAIAIALSLGLASTVYAADVTINFEELPGQTSFNSGPSTVPLSNEYAAQGVLFEGSPTDSTKKGGWIWNTGFDSGDHTPGAGNRRVLNFNPNLTYAGGGQNDTTQIIRFSTPASQVSLWINWQSGEDNADPSTFDPQALLNLLAVDEGVSGDLYIDQHIINNVGESVPGTWYQLTVSAGPGEAIDRVELNVINREDLAGFRVDDLQVTFVPEPAALAILSLALPALLRRRMRARG